MRMLAQMVACEIHPVNNLRILTSLRTLFGASDEDVNNWFRHWVNETFEPLEKLLATAKETGQFCHGDTPGLADICLVAQVTNNARFGVDMNALPDHCAHQRRLHGAAGLPEGRTGQPARCGVIVSSALRAPLHRLSGGHLSTATRAGSKLEPSVAVGSSPRFTGERVAEGGGGGSAIP